MTEELKILMQAADAIRREKQQRDEVEELHGEIVTDAYDEDEEHDEG